MDPQKFRPEISRIQLETHVQCAVVITVSFMNMTLAGQTGTLLYSLQRLFNLQSHFKVQMCEGNERK